MKAYKTLATIQDSQKVILSNVPFSPGQQVEVLLLVKEEESHSIQSLKALFKTTQELPQAKSITEEEIAEEIEQYRRGN